MKPTCLILNQTNRLIALLALLLAAAGSSRASDYDFDRVDTKKPIVRLDGAWKFSVGDTVNWAQPEFDDTGWAEIRAPGHWDDQGYDDYHGYAWYRKSFTFPKGSPTQGIRLFLGKVDDVDQVYVNGELVGATGQFPPDYVTACDKDRIYELPSTCLKPGQKNVIAVRVYDEGGYAGIYEGPLGLYASSIPQPFMRIEGTWLFHPGDNPAWKEELCDEADFGRILVPANWENQGYTNLDGFAWYRITFSHPAKLSDSTAVLLVGKIDDLDETYLNGTFVGATGNMKKLNVNDYRISPHAQFRAYPFPASLLKQTNTLAIRVYDMVGVGGIYAGPIGIMSQSDFTKFWEAKSKENKRGWGRNIRIELF